MSGDIPANLDYFLKNGIKDADDGYEYSSELNRILNSDSCQRTLSSREIEALREYAEDVRKNVGEINHYSEEKVMDIEREHFGSRGIYGFLGVKKDTPKPEWPF